MFTRNAIRNTLVTAFVLSMTSLASAHSFPKPPTKAEIAAERAASCKAPVTTGATLKQRLTRFGSPSVVTTGASYRVAGAHRFGGSKYVPVVACTRPTRSHVACL